MRVLRVSYRHSVFYAALMANTVICLNKELGYEAPIPLEEVTILPPVAPTKVICLAVNYRKHAEEVGRDIPEEPVLFLKPPSAVISGFSPIVLPPQSNQVDFEGELAIVMGRACRNISEEDARQSIFGFACANDVTARDLQKKDGLFARAKGFDTFAPIGPWIETEVEDPSNLMLKTTVNGQVKQEENTSDMIFPPFSIISYVSSVMTLLPGDVILTGTPSGIGPLAPGDEVKVEISGVGELTNPVVAAEENDDTPGAPIQ